MGVDHVADVVHVGVFIVGDIGVAMAVLPNQIRAMLNGR